MSDLYALLVGINRYASDLVPSLTGCVNDVDDALALLKTRARGRVLPLVLRDEQASRAAVVEALRNHLGQAGPQDTALFWFSGHGSQAPVPEWAWFEEPTGMLQTLVCADSRTPGVPDLWDKELSVLLDGIAVKAGHVAVVLDSCHSEGGTRDAVRVRSVPPGPTRPIESLIAELTPPVDGPGPAPEHVMMSACRRDQTAEERLLGGRRNGLFSWALRQAIARMGPAAGYRELLAATRSEVARLGASQEPQLYPAGTPLIHQPFLGGAVTRPAGTLEMTYGGDGWEINAGSAHGLPTATDGLRLGVPSSRLEAKVLTVLTERSLVEPLGGWEPDRERPLHVVLTAAAEPAATVAVADARLRSQLGGPFLREARAGEVADLTADVAGDEVIIRQDGRDDERVPAGSAVRAMEHIARWRRVRNLVNPVTELVDPIEIEIVEALPGQTVAPATALPMTVGKSGGYELSYRGAEAPEIFIRLHNRWHRQLYCTLLDLTSRYSISAALFPVTPIAPDHRGAALRGRRIRVSLPAGTPVEPGRSVTDWLVLVVSERPFSEEPYLLPDLRSATRDFSPADSVPAERADWTTKVVSMITTVRAPT